MAMHSTNSPTRHFRVRRQYHVSTIQAFRIHTTTDILICANITDQACVPQQIAIHLCDFKDPYAHHRGACAMCRLHNRGSFDHAHSRNHLHQHLDHILLGMILIIKQQYLVWLPRIDFRRCGLLYFLHWTFQQPHSSITSTKRFLLLTEELGWRVWDVCHGNGVGGLFCSW